MRYSAASMALRMLVTLTYTQRHALIHCSDPHTFFPPGVDGVTQLVLTGRSLDILCSCLMLWLRELCDDAVKAKQSQQSKAARLCALWYLANHITALTTLMGLTQQHNVTSAASYPRLHIFLSTFSGKKKEEKTAANYDTHFDHNSTSHLVLFSDGLEEMKQRLWLDKISATAGFVSTAAPNNEMLLLLL